MMSSVVVALWAMASVPVSPSTVEPRVMAVVVGSNTSLTPGRGHLAFADDDAVKYALFLQAFAAPSDITLLTELDADSERLFSATLRPSGLPTVAEVDRALSALADEVRAHPGEPFEFFFVFAGHGDVDRGKGVLELADGPFDADRLSAHLKELAPHRVHLVLDSCNSFFMLTPRKPGGRRYATPDTVAEVFRKELPHVGAILSTSAENEVYEWSELQSGVFSHLVRSGGVGFADADADGVVRYGELEAFISVATGSIVNPVYRPRVFVRGQEGRATPLFRLRGSRAQQLELSLPAQSRVSVRDERGLRWFDANLEAGAQVKLAVALPLAARFGLRLAASGVGFDDRYEVGLSPVGGSLALVLAPRTEPGTPRGAGEQVSGLYDEPFGPRAWQAYASAPLPAQVFGLSRSEARRLGSVVEAFAAAELDTRTRVIMEGLGAAAIAGTNLGISASRQTVEPAMTLGVGLIAISVVEAPLAIRLGRVVSPEGLRRLARELSDAADPSEPMTRLDAAVAKLKRLDGISRHWEFALEGLALSLAATGLGLTELAFGLSSPEKRAASLEAQSAFRRTCIVTMIGALAAILDTALDVSRRRFLDMWNADPVVAERLRLSFVPIAGGALLSASASF